jgi:hypothetical protein
MKYFCVRLYVKIDVVAASFSPHILLPHCYQNIFSIIIMKIINKDADKKHPFTALDQYNDAT